MKNSPKERTPDKNLDTLGSKNFQICRELMIFLFCELLEEKRVKGVANYFWHDLKVIKRKLMRRAEFSVKKIIFNYKKIEISR